MSENIPGLKAMPECRFPVLRELECHLDRGFQSEVHDDPTLYSRPVYVHCSGEKVLNIHQVYLIGKNKLK